MLVLTRKIGEEIVIGDNVRLKVVAIHGNQVRLGFTAPEDVIINRSELADFVSGAADGEPCGPACRGR